MALRSTRTPLALAALTLLAGSLGACRNNKVETTGSIYPTDYRTRHPYVLQEGARTLDVFPAGIGHLDPRQTTDVEAFLLEYRRFGRGAIVIDLPSGDAPAKVAAGERTGAAVRRIAAERNVPPNAIAVSRYPVADPSLASPVRLSFQRTEAKVSSACGLWPQDLGASDYAFDMRNEPGWNLGCATRSNIAAQVDDPTDLVRGRELGTSDAVRRKQVIEKLRDSKDPSTLWRQDGSAKVKDQVGN